MNRRKLGRFISTAAFPSIIVAIVVLAFLFRREIGQVFSSKERFQGWIDSFGALGPLMFMGVQVFQVIIFIVPGEVAQIAGGFLFGAWGGIFYSLIGITVGSAFNFFLARLLGVSFVEGLFKADQVARFETVISSSRARAGFFLLFLIPGIPKDILCYVAGLSRIGFVPFLLISMTGRLPGIVGSAIIGSSAAKNNWVVTLSVTGAAVVAFVAGLLFRSRIHALAERISRRRGPDPQ